ncbi:MAG: hypothetical protein WCV73_00030 [Patescibacteria group bacterium]|jgi:hypothetical protein
MSFGTKKFIHNFIKYLGIYIVRICPTVFVVFGTTFIAYFALENFKTGLISNYFDLNLLLVFAIISGLIILLFGQNYANISQISSFFHYHRPRIKKYYYLFAGIFAILVALFLYLALADILGDLGVFTAIFGALLIYLVLNLFYDSRR